MAALNELFTNAADLNSISHVILNPNNSQLGNV